VSSTTMSGSHSAMEGSSTSDPWHASTRPATDGSEQLSLGNRTPDSSGCRRRRTLLYTVKARARVKLPVMSASASGVTTWRARHAASQASGFRAVLQAAHGRSSNETPMRTPTRRQQGATQNATAEARAVCASLTRHHDLKPKQRYLDGEIRGCSNALIAGVHPSNCLARPAHGAVHAGARAPIAVRPGIHNEACFSGSWRLARAISRRVPRICAAQGSWAGTRRWHCGRRSAGEEPADFQEGPQHLPRDAGGANEVQHSHGPRVPL
jgi:hypothetical protein